MPPWAEMKAASPVEVMESVTMVVPGCSRSRIADIMAMSRLQLSSLFRDGNGVGVQSSYVNVGFLVEGNDEHVFIAIGVGQGDGVFPEAEKCMKSSYRPVGLARISPELRLSSETRTDQLSSRPSPGRPRGRSAA